MMKVKKMLSMAALTGTVVGVSAAPVGAKDLAKVNNATITIRDLELSLSSLNEGQRSKFLNDANNRRQILANVIDHELLVQEAEKLKLEQESRYKEAMAQYRKQLLVNLLLDKKLASQLTSNALKSYYKAHLSEFSTDQVQVQHILVSDENEAKQLLALAKDPKSDFQALAEKHSKDPSAKNNRGDIGFITRGQMVPEFSRVAFDTPVGEITGPIHTSFGYHVIKVVKKKAGKTLGFDEVEPQVRLALRQQLALNYVTGLKGQAKIEINEEALSKN